MKKHLRIILIILLCAFILGEGLAFIQAQSASYSETNSFASTYYIGKTDQKKPFFDVILPEIEKNIKENNKHSLTPYYDAFPVANNPENFQGLGSTSYANINGETVTAEAFLRHYGDSLHDPNAGMGLLLFQCIQYKRAHPEEDVKLTMSYYRTSASASVCVIPESKYYGYMRSLYGTNYDEHGFVRIAYMLTEAARMGIEVTLVNQLNSYSVRQYDPSTKSLKSRSPLNYITYFNKALETDCYNTYAPGKRVSDYMNFVVVGWNVGDKTTDMQHLKSLTASHYLATDGTEHKNAVFFTSSNLDDNDYKGRNGNGLAQSGVIITNHEALYRVTYNYTQLMTQYSGLEELFELQKLVNERNVEQAEMIRNGQGSLIPKDEQIVYIGGENDPVFELYFTPFGGGMDVWDTENNAFCKYMDKMAASDDYVEYAFNVFGYGKSYIGYTMERMVEQAFCKNPDSRNKLFLRITDFDTDSVQKLALGTEIGERDISDGSKYHTKDMLLNYEENGVRHRVSLLSSCNSYPLAFSLRTNSLLVINETDASGGNFYSIYGDKFTNGMFSNDLLISPGDLSMAAGTEQKLDVFYPGDKTLTWTSSDPNVATVSNGTVKALKKGYAVITATDGIVAKSIKLSVGDCAACMTAGDGLHASTAEQYILTQRIDDVPFTFEAEFTLDKSNLTGVNTLLGMDDSFSGGWAFTVNKDGHPRVMIRNKAGYNTTGSYVFNNVDVATGQKVHMAIVVDTTNKLLHCYVDGELAETITGFTRSTDFGTKYAPLVGGDYRSGNGTYFTGTIHSISVWADMRSASEIIKDYTNGITASDSKLLASYDFTKCDSCMLKDLSTKKNNLSVLKLWLDKSEVEPVTDYAYSFAVVGDTQTMCEKDPEAMDSIYNWLIANKDTHKIKYVLGMGDITDDSTDIEWERANAYISKLNGVIPYSLCRGNHDDWDDFNRHLHNGFYEATVDGMMNEGDVDLTDPTQPGLIEGTLPDGSTGLVTREEDVPEGGIVKGDLTNSYRTIEVSGTKYLIMTLDFAPNSEALKWANDVIAAHPDHWVIATTHAYMYRDGTTIDASDCYPPSYYSGYTDAQNGDQMWDKVFSQHKNVLLVLSGHDPWQHIVYRQDKGVNGNTVTQMLIDAQYTDLYIGSTAMVAMLYFSEDGQTMTVRYYSVEKDCYGSEISQFTINLK